MAGKPVTVDVALYVPDSLSHLVNISVVHPRPLTRDDHTGVSACRRYMERLVGRKITTPIKVRLTAEVIE